MVGDIIDKSEVLKKADEINNREVVRNSSISEEIDNTDYLNYIDSVIPEKNTEDNQIIDNNIPNSIKSEIVKKVKSSLESYVGNTGILDSGNRTEFSTGAVRDIQDDKGDEYLLPFCEVRDMMDDYLNMIGNSNYERMSDFNAKVFEYLERYKNTGMRRYLTSIADEISNYVYNSDTPEAIMEVAIHFKNGATKYSPRNWEKGMPVSNYISSFLRHYLKFMRGDKDEHHERAMLWNILCASYTAKKMPELNDFVLANIESAEG